MMNEVRAHIQELMMRLQFPINAQKELIDAYDAIVQNKDTCNGFQALLSAYESSEHCNYKQMIACAIELGAKLEFHGYTVSLLLFLCLSKRLYLRYIERGISEDIYYRSMADLAYKLEECRLVYGINGSFVASWFSGFFALTRFGLGRLQFELVKTAEPFVLAGDMIPAGSLAINLHIPRTGTKLCHQEVLASYRMAAEMFKKDFGNKPILFICKSWLLDPWNRKVLKPDSNLALFYNDFEIVQTGVYEDYRDLWRLFDCQYTGNPEELPQDSSLRRAYADRVSRGEPIGWGIGMFSLH